MHMAHLLDRVVNRPLMVAPDKLAVILTVLSGRLGMDVSGLGVEIDAGLVAPPVIDARLGGNLSKHEKGGFRVTSEGIALIPVHGTLVNRGAWVGASSGLTSYEGLTHQLKEAEKDQSVRGVLLDLNSPGGEAAGAFDVPELIQAVRKSKPVFAHVNDMAASAGYAVASAADEIWTTRTGVLGSIGVVMVHFDRSGAYEKAGVAPTIIHAGAKKADGNPYAPLPKAVRDRYRAELETMREMFVASVVAGRPKLNAVDVKATEAGVFMGEEAVAAGLADGVATFDRVLELMRDRVGRVPKASPGYLSQKQETPSMSETTTAPAAQAPDQAALDAAATRGRSEGMQAGRTAERDRIRGILRAAEAEGRADLAAEIALETEMSAEDARKVLAKAPKADAGQGRPGQAFYDAVAKSGGNPKVSSVGASGDEGESRFVAETRAKYQKRA